MNPTEITNENTKKLVSSSQKLISIEKIANETETISLDALNKLKEQGETIDKVHTTTIDIGYDIGDSTKYLNDIDKENKKFKMILFYIILVLSALIMAVYKIKN
jgi:t-SNARE complex subunit (syntaxin)